MRERRYLDQACRDDSALRVTVDSMLRAHDEAGSFGETPAFVPSGTVKRLAPGTQLGPFRIETLLGAGGMGEVYRAHDTKLQRAVAIKVLPDSFAHDADRRSRFEAEARALAALNHPHIGAIYGVEESEDVVALVLELVDGLTLDERLAAGPIAFDEIRRLARQLADGLEAAHDRGIVHRDFKPGNIKITPDGNVKILDFGLAKIDDSQIGIATLSSPSGSRQATQVGVVVGTAGYMSPEQARGTGGRQAHGHLGIWLRAVQDLRATAAVYWHHGDRCAESGHRRRARLGPLAGEHAAIPRSHLATVSDEGSEVATARHRRGADHT